MAFLTNSYSCEGFMFVLWKTWTFGNEYHTICWGCRVLYLGCNQLKLKTFQSIRSSQHINKMVELPVAYCWGWQRQYGVKRCYWCWILDFVLCGKSLNWARLGVLRQRWLKRRFWTNNVDGEAVKEHFYGKNVGRFGAISGIIDVQKLNINVMKESHYTTMLITTCGNLEKVSMRDNSASMGRQCVTIIQIVCNNYIY